MRTIFVNGRFYGQPVSGVQRYARETVRHIDSLLAERGSAAKWVLLTPPGAGAASLKFIEQRTVGTLSGHAWDQISFYRRAASGVALCLGGAGPLLQSRQIVVIHDAAVYRHPEHFGRSYGLLHRSLGRILAKRVTLATVSQFSRRELSAVLGARTDAILVAPNGSDHVNISGADDVVARLGLDRGPFFVTLGNLTRNKNISVAVRALSKLPAGYAKLVVIGALDERLFGDAGMTTSDDVVLAGRLSDREVTGLMQKARALIFPSIYEGFGIPPVEAMVNRCPVIASRIPAVEEVCGQAAAYFDTFDEDALASLMKRAVDDDAWRTRAIERGSARVGQFRWETAATVLMQACEALA